MSDIFVTRCLQIVIRIVVEPVRRIFLKFLQVTSRVSMKLSTWTRHLYVKFSSERHDHLTKLMLDKERQSCVMRDLTAHVYQHGRTAIRNKVLANLTHDTLQKSLHAARVKIKKEKRQLKLGKAWRTLFPANDEPLNEDNFDITVWTILARYVTCGGGKFNWNKTPREDEIEWQDDVLRLKSARNHLAHMPNSNFDPEELLREVELALARLGTPDEQIRTLHWQKNIHPHGIAYHNCHDFVVTLQTGR